MCCDFSFDWNSISYHRCQFPFDTLYELQPTCFLFLRKGNLTVYHYNAQMFLINFSKVRFIHTTGKILAVTYMLSRDFLNFSAITCQRILITLPLHNELLQVQHDNYSKEVQYSVVRCTWRKSSNSKKWLKPQTRNAW